MYIIASKWLQSFVQIDFLQFHSSCKRACKVQPELVWNANIGTKFVSTARKSGFKVQNLNVFAQEVIKVFFERLSMWAPVGSILSCVFEQSIRESSSFVMKKGVDGPESMRDFAKEVVGPKLIIWETDES